MPVSFPPSISGCTKMISLVKQLVETDQAFEQAQIKALALIRLLFLELDFR